MKVDRRGGSRLQRVASCVLGLTLVLAFAVAYGAAASSTAAAASIGREKLPGHQGLVPPGATLVGPAPAATPLPLTVTLKPRDPAALAAEVQAVSDPGSAEYHHFLTPAQFAEQFGPTPATLAQVTSSLRQEGLTVGVPSATGLALPVSGTVAQVQTAFSTPISQYRLSSGKTGYDNATAPEVDTSVAPQIQGILGLDTLSPPQPSTSVPQASPAVPHPAADPAAPTLAAGQPSPVTGTCATSISGVKSSTGALEAPDLAQAYAFDPLYSSNDYGANSTVALLEMAGAGYSQSDITTFAGCYGITIGNNQIAQTDIDGGGATGGGTAEAELDIETVLALAPEANIEVYEGGSSDSLYTVFNKIIGDDTAKIVSASWTNGCEAYVGQSFQDSENTLFQAAATEGQSVFVASGDQGAQGCNINGEIDASTGTNPVAQSVDPSTGTLYVANKSSNTVSVDSEGTTSDPTGFATAASVSTGTGSGPDAVALDTTAGKVFVANSSSTLTVISTSACNQSTTTGCASPTQIASGGHLSSPAAVAVSGSTLYVANTNGTVAVYNATTNAWVATVTLASSTVPTALAVDAANGFAYVADGANGRIEYFNAATCNATTTSTCGTTPAAITAGNDPVALTVSSTSGDLYVANAGTGGGITVVSLGSHTVVKTIATTQPSNGTGLVQSIGLSPDGSEVLAVLDGLSFPGDVMATINTSTNTISSTVSLETGTDAMGQLVSDGSRDYVWVTDKTSRGDVIQNLNPAVSDPAGQPDVTAVGGTSLGHGSQTLGPPATEQAWNDALYYSEGAGGGGISQTFVMPAYQQPLGEVSGSSGAPCADAGGDCREVPDVSADADPSSGYIIYDSVNGLGWNALGGTSGAAPLWAAVVAVVASANHNTAGYGQMNPALYLLAQQSPSTYLNDVTLGNNDYNATASGQYPAMTGYDMATGLGTPVASALATGLASMPLSVTITGSQTYGQSPVFAAAANFAGTGTTPFGVTLDSTNLSCTTVGASTTISPSLAPGGYTILASSCVGLTLSGVDANDYTIVSATPANDFTVNSIPVNVAVSGTQTYGGTPTFSGTDNPPSGITVNTSGLLCTRIGLMTIGLTMSVGSYTLAPSGCSGATLGGSNTTGYAVAYTSAAGDFSVTKAPLTVTASSPTMGYGGTVPTITPAYSGFVNSDSAASLTTKPTCSTTATSSSPVLGSPYVSSCGGAVDPNYAISYVGGAVAITAATLTITASSGSMAYGGVVPTITPTYAGFVNNDTSASLNPLPTCSTTATSSSSASGSPYLTSCSGAADPNYAISYVTGVLVVGKATLTITASSSPMTYGGVVPTITPTYAGFVNNDTSSSLTTTPTCRTTATSGSSVSGSPYPTSCTGAVDPNYTISYTQGSVSVGQAPLTITASSPTTVYGTVATIMPSYSAFANGDASPSLTRQPTCSTTQVASSPVASSFYASSCTGAVDSNYAITYVSGSVTVGAAPLTVTASSGSVAYGSTRAVTPIYSGLAGGDTGSSLTPPPTCGSTATNSSPVLGSPYTSSCSGASDPNYTITYASGVTTVTPKPVPLAVSGNQANSGTPSFNGTYANLPAGLVADTSGLTCGEVTPSIPINGSLASGSYTLVPATCAGVALSGPNASNYSVGYTSASSDFQVTGGPVQTPPPVRTYGYWLVGSDGGIFTFGSAQFYGSTGNIKLQRPVVGISPTANKAGYWLVASDGGVFAFGNAGYYGSIPGAGLSPAGSGLPNSLNAPIVGMVPSSDGAGYFMVASDGGVFAFGDARFEGSCPGRGGCSGTAVAVVPDASGNGYWLATQTGNVYAFGDATFYGAPGNQGSSVTSAVRTADGGGYWILLADGAVYAYGDAVSRGGPVGAVGGFNPASAIFSDADGGGYWVASAAGAVYAYGDAPNEGSMTGNHLNGSIIAATGF
ncbi:MAG TPA: MBG domain-containing protein [Acidimicrobiales bacterium]|jgi:6-phosphogluconolactonase (cycloisomerase 2 family)|nr:MBG domain-containing protein [Acidimicrobiales bacterium]